ncbi:interleukin 12 receptor subunit beta 2 [Pitangus sulphuratus]|nr:interleukin 12 receptor subunit beta 2 [Pitangus sulphuratus]
MPGEPGRVAQRLQGISSSTGSRTLGSGSLWLWGDTNRRELTDLFMVWSKMAFAWIVPSAVWLVMHFKAEACRKGIMTSSKAPHGTEEICDKGTMTANTASAIQCGTNVTLSCHLGGLQTPNCKIGIFLNNSKQVTNSGHSVEISSSEQYHLHGLEPDTAYEFQVSCKIHPERGLWSNWSTKQTRTPEAEPTGIPDVWYRLSAAQLGSQQQNISLFWKALSKSEAGGRILGYRVTFEALDHWNSPIESHQTTHTSYSKVTPRVGYKITVTAQNSRGSSPPASILTNLSIQDLPPPQQVSAMAMGNSSILVSWKPPLRSAVPISGYVVEWAETGMNPHLEPHHTWAKLPASNLSTVIAEHIKDNVCYQIHVFALYQDRAGQAASVRGYSTAQAIPEGTAPRSLYIPDLQPGELYDLWVTGSTAAGEGPRGNSDRLRLESARGWVTVVLTCSFFIFSACVCFVPPARKAFHSLLSMLLPQCKNEAIPDPANATWAKSFMATKAQLSSLSILFLPSTISFEEPEPTLVEEAFEQPDPLAPGDKLLVGSAGSRGHGDWTRQSSSPEPGEEQQLPEMYQRLVVEATEHLQPVPEYITNPSTTDLPPSSDTTRDHPTDLPEYITSPGPTDLPLPTDTPMDHPELECHPLSIFPTTFLAPTLCSEGNLTLDRVKLNCSSFTR